MSGQKGTITISCSGFHSAVKDADAASFAARHPQGDGSRNAEPAASRPAPHSEGWRWSRQGLPPTMCADPARALFSVWVFPLCPRLLSGLPRPSHLCPKLLPAPFAHLAKKSETKHCFTKLLQKPIPVGCCLLFWKTRTTYVWSGMWGRWGEAAPWQHRWKRHLLLPWFALLWFVSSSKHAQIRKGLVGATFCLCSLSRPN